MQKLCSACSPGFDVQTLCGSLARSMLCEARARRSRRTCATRCCRRCGKPMRNSAGCGDTMHAALLLASGKADAELFSPFRVHRLVCQLPREVVAVAFVARLSAAALDGRSPSPRPVQPTDSFAPPSQRAKPRMPPDGNRASQRAPPTVVRGGAAFSLKEVAQHNTPGDCWLVLRGKVYDVSQWCEAAAARRAPCGATPGCAGARLTTRASGCRCTPADR